MVVGLGTFVGLLTGLGTIVGWIASEESFGEVADVTVGWAGLVYFGLLTSGGFVIALFPQWFRIKQYPVLKAMPLYLVRIFYAVGGVSLSLLFVAGGFDPDDYVFAGYIFLGLIAVILVALAIESAIQHRSPGVNASTAR